MMYVLILAFVLTCVSCERKTLGLDARTNEDTAPLDHSSRRYNMRPLVKPMIEHGVPLMVEHGVPLIVEHAPAIIKHVENGFSGAIKEIKSWWGRRKRSTEGEEQRFQVTIQADPCAFNNYDANGDDMITWDELEAIFGDGEATLKLAEALDESGDEKVNEEEFKKDMHKYVEGC